MIYCLLTSSFKKKMRVVMHMYVPVFTCMDIRLALIHIPV
uniref:Uncharacterized protein n=1 Tax=Anguilla anguilla TaxID=7936 RepID=A0A0E9Q6I3_ANGAN